MNRYLLIFIFSAYALYAEPSAFSAGDLSVDEPYGLTENEKLLLKNIKTVKHLKRDKNALYSEVENLRSDVNGLRSVVDGLNVNAQKTRLKLKKIALTLEDLQVASQNHDQHFLDVDQNISQLQAQILEIGKIQEENYKKIEQAISGFEKDFKLLQSQTVSKKSFNALQDELNSLKALITTEFKRLGSKKSKSKKSATLFQEGLKALKAKKYKIAIARFEETIKRNYKPAGSHFYLAEAHYRIKSYKKAIAYYKESYRRYKKGSYNPSLFLHMALSLERTGQKKAAKKFLKVLLKKYPKSAEARVAKKHL